MSLNSFLSMAGWYVLPGLATNYIQPVLYTIFTRAGDPKPQAGSARFVHDRRRIQIAVIVLYLLYTIYDADYQIRRQGNFYRDLGVALDVDEKGIQSRFRRLTVQFHPDKVSSAADKLSMEGIYVQLKLARDTLLDPAKRFAYDRLGTDMLSSTPAANENITTALAIRDLVLPGIQRIAAEYVASGAMLMILSMFGYLQDGKFWRYLIMTVMLAAEISVLTSPTFPSVLTKAVNPLFLYTGLRDPYLPFQMLTLLRKLVLTVFIAITQLTPLVSDPRAQAQSDDKISQALLQQIDGLTRQTAEEVVRMTALELAPFAGAGEGRHSNGMRSLRETCKEWLVQNTIRNEPEVKKAMSDFLARKKAQDSAGGGNQPVNSG